MIRTRRWGAWPLACALVLVAAAAVVVVAVVVALVAWMQGSGVVTRVTDLNLAVSKLDQAGRGELGDSVDRTCRWAVPAGFFCANALSAAYFLIFH